MPQTDAFHIAHQSTARIEWVPGNTDKFFCIASPHTSECEYKWKNMFGPVGVNSPVLHVKLPGVYICTVRRGDEELTSREMVIYESKT